jgi:hypothetical protein
MTNLKKILDNGVEMFELEVENDFGEAQHILDHNMHTQNIDAEYAYEDRVSNDFEGTYKTKIQRLIDYKRFISLMDDEQDHIRREVSKNRNKIYNNWQRGLSTRMEAIELMARQDKKLNIDCKCKVCSFNLSIDEWKSGKMSSGAKVGKSLRKAGFSQTLIDFYSQQVKTEKEIYITVASQAQFIAGMSYYCEMDSWDGYNGSSCQDPRHGDDAYPIKLGGALHDDKLFIGMLHEEIEDLKDMENKLLARTLFRLIHVDDKPALIATYYYGNNETKDLLHGALSQLKEVDIYSKDIRGGNVEIIKENANGAFNMVTVDDVHIYIDEWETVEVECPACGGDGEIEVYSNLCDCDIEIECPACHGSGEIEEEIHVHVDEWKEVEGEREVLPYDEAYTHYGSYIDMIVDVNKIREYREEQEEKEWDKIEDRISDEVEEMNRVAIEMMERGE